MRSFVFQGVERRYGKVVAVFRHPTMYDFVYQWGRYVSVPRSTTALDLRSLRLRIDNLRNQGYDTSEEEKAEQELQRRIDKDAND